MASALPNQLARISETAWKRQLPSLHWEWLQDSRPVGMPPFVLTFFGGRDSPVAEPSLLLVSLIGRNFHGSAPCLTSPTNPAPSTKEKADRTGGLFCGLLFRRKAVMGAPVDTTEITAGPCGGVFRLGASEPLRHWKKLITSTLVKPLSNTIFHIFFRHAMRDSEEFPHATTTGWTPIWRRPSTAPSPWRLASSHANFAA